MAQFNPDFWEVPTDSCFLENTAAENALWYETDVDRERRYAMKDFFVSVMPTVQTLIDEKLTKRQREVVRLYFFLGMTQENIADELDLTQSTVSRHLFGTVRNGKKVGGALNKLRKAVERANSEPIETALAALKQRFEQAA